MISLQQIHDQMHSCFSTFLSRISWEMCTLACCINDTCLCCLFNIGEYAYNWAVVKITGEGRRIFEAWSSFWTSAGISFDAALVLESVNSFPLAFVILWVWTDMNQVNGVCVQKKAGNLSTVIQDGHYFSDMKNLKMSWRLGKWDIHSSRNAICSNRCNKVKNGIMV